jgi:hypothetical protein
MSEGISMSEGRDDTNLHSLVCPHCKQTTSIPEVQAFEKQQLVYVRCGHCNAGITKEQIANTYREYK